MVRLMPLSVLTAVNRAIPGDDEEGRRRQRSHRDERGVGAPRGEGAVRHCQEYVELPAQLGVLLLRWQILVVDVATDCEAGIGWRG